MSEKRVLPLLQRTGSSLGLNLSGLNTSAAPMTRRDSSIFSDSRLRKIADKLENVSDDAGSYTERLAETIENIRNTMKKLLYSSYIGKLFSVAMLLLSILSVIEYIYTTYLNQESDASQYSALKVLELIVALFFAFDWGLSFFVADHKMTFLSSFYSMVDLMTVVPIFATYSETCEHYMVNQYDYSAHQMIFYVLCSLNTTRILRALRLHRVVEKYLEDEVEKCLGHMALNIIVMILFNSALMQFIEENQNYAFHTWMYYMTVTITSVGYGDITPKTDLGRFTAMAMISFAIISVPQMTNELIEKMSRQSVYARLRYYPKTSSSSHVLVCGDLSSVSWKEFFEELFHEDHETKGLLDCVILQPNVPNYEMRNHMKDPRYFGCITYLEGSPLSDADLKRADAINARAIFLLTNKFTANPDEEDAKIILEQFSIQKYLRLYSIPGMMSSPLFCLQLIRPENRRHLVQVEKGDVLTSSSTASFYESGEGGAGGGGGGNDGSGGGGSGGGSASLRQEESDVVICLNEIKMGVIAKAVMFPGTNTLIMNLLTSFSDDVAGAGAGNALHQKNAVKPMEGIETLEEDERGSDWIGEYQRGCDWEIYTTELSHTFEGTTFSALADMLYHKLGIVLFGLEVEEGGNQRYRGGGGSGGGSGGGGSRNRRSKIYLNPADYVIPSSDDCKVLAFVIAKNKAQSDLTFSKVNEDSIFHSGSGMTFTHISLLANAMNARLTGDVNPKAPVTPHNSPTITANKRSSGVARTSNASKTVGGSGGGTTGGNLRTTISAHPRHRGVAFGLNLKKREKLPWQRLLHKYEQEKTTESIQEELQRYEDRMLHEHYFTRHNDTIELSDVYIQTSVSEDIPFVENHIIIIGKALSNLYDLIKPLRAKALGVLKHIIILYPYDFPMHVWQRIAVFESVWIVRGSGLEEADLRRCGIFKAKQVILLGAAAAVMSSLAAAVGGGSEGSSGGSGGLGGADKTLTSAGYETSNSALDDVDTVFCYQAIKRMNESAHIVVEIIHHSNVAYLDPESGLNSSVVDYKFTAQFSAGSLFASSILDTLVCQAFYNTKIIDILKKLIGVDEKITVNELPQSSGIGGGGGGGKGSAVAAAKGLVNSSLYQIPLPEGLETRTYGALFSLLAKRKQIPLGILRGIFSNTKSGPKANILPYVFTNPPKDTELFSCDKIFVLSQTPIKITRIVKDESKEFHMYSTMRAKRKTAEDVLNLVNIVKDQVIRHHDKNNDLENKLTTLMTSFQQQMKEMTSCMSQIVQEVENQRQEKDYYLQQQRQQRYQTMMMSQSNDYNDDVITVTDVHGSGGGGGGRYGRARSSTQDSILTTATSATSAARMNGSPKSARGVGKSVSTSFIRPKAVVDPLPLGGVGGGGGSGGKSRNTSVRTPPSSTPPQVQRKSNRQSPASSPLINTSSRKRFMNSNASV